MNWGTNIKKDNHLNLTERFSKDGQCSIKQAIKTVTSYSPQQLKDIPVKFYLYSHRQKDWYQFAREQKKKKKKKERAQSL